MPRRRSSSTSSSRIPFPAPARLRPAPAGVPAHELRRRRRSICGRRERVRSLSGSHRRSPSGARRTAAASDEYPPRAEVGRYLADGLERSAPAPRRRVAGVTLRRERARPRRARRRRLERDDSRPPRAPTTRSCSRSGHQPRSRTRSRGLAHAAPLVPAVFPVERRLAPDAVPPGATVAVRGFALTFIDAALALTEGRGGLFEPLAHPYRLRYVPARTTPARDPARSRAPAGRCSPSPRRRSRGDARCCERIAARGTRARAAAPHFQARRRRRVAREPAAHRRPLARGRSRAPVPGRDARSAPARSASIERSLAVARRPRAAGRRVGARATRGERSTRRSSRGSAATGSRRPTGRRSCSLAAEMERIAFGPPAGQRRQAARAGRGGRVDLAHRARRRASTAARPTALRSAQARRRSTWSSTRCSRAPGLSGTPVLAAGLVADGFGAHRARPARPRRRADGTCVGADGVALRGLAAIGRPTEDSVIGNDTLSRTLHPHADRWARRVVEPRAATASRVRAAAASRHERPRRLSRDRRAAGAARAVAGAALRAARAHRRRGSRSTARRSTCIDPAPLARNAAELARAARAHGVDFRDLLRAQGQQGARARRRRPSASASGSTSPARASCGRCWPRRRPPLTSSSPRRSSRAALLELCAGARRRPS